MKDVSLEQLERVARESTTRAVGVALNGIFEKLDGVQEKLDSVNAMSSTVLQKTEEYVQLCQQYAELHKTVKAIGTAVEQLQERVAQLEAPKPVRNVMEVFGCSKGEAEYMMSEGAHRELDIPS